MEASISWFRLPIVTKTLLQVVSGACHEGGHLQLVIVSVKGVVPQPRLLAWSAPQQELGKSFLPSSCRGAPFRVAEASAGGYFNTELGRFFPGNRAWSLWAGDSKGLGVGWGGVCYLDGRHWRHGGDCWDVDNSVIWLGGAGEESEHVGKCQCWTTKNIHKWLVKWLNSSG